MSRKRPKVLTLRIWYYTGRLPLEFVDMEAEGWDTEHGADDKVVFLDFLYRGERIGRSCGSDNYAVEGSQLYLWSEPNQPWIDPLRGIGSVHDILDDTVRPGRTIYEPPRLSCLVRRGIMLPDKDARAIGLI
jgi:hypothetical protein